jgi:hypothetical protein
MIRAAAQSGEESAAPALATGITGGAAAAVTTGCAGRNNGRSRVLHLGDAGCLVRAGRPSRGYQEQRSIHSEDLQGGWVARVRGGWREPTAGSSRPVPVGGLRVFLPLSGQYPSVDGCSPTGSVRGGRSLLNYFGSHGARSLKGCRIIPGGPIFPRFLTKRQREAVMGNG